MNTSVEKEKSPERRPDKETPFSNSVRFLLCAITKSDSEDEDIGRKKFILNILLAVSILISATLSLFVLFYTLTRPVYRGIPLHSVLFVTGFFAVLLFLSKKGMFSIAAYSFIATFFAVVTFALYNWGVELPEGLLAYAFVIVMSGVLIDTRFAFETAFMISGMTILLAYFQTSGITNPRLYWKPESITISDAVEFSIMFAAIAVVSWLSNREIERSLERARKSEADLKKERDLLEVRVRERTRELEKAQMEEMSQASRFIEFGKISSGLFHDIINHITFLFFDIEKATEAEEKDLAETKEYLRQANENKAALTEYIEDAKKQFQNQKTESLFSIKKEIMSVARILGYKLKTEKVFLDIGGDRDILTYGNAVRFNHAVTNIVLNAMDAYEKNDGEDKSITVNLLKRGNKAAVSVEDRAGGIPEEIRARIFEPFFTTKGPRKGAGIGLTTAKNTIEEDFGGEIRVDSVWGQGTKFTIEFPIKNKSDEEERI